MKEEGIRCKKTWMQFDQKMYTAAFGLDIHKEVADPKGWMENVKDISIVMEDEVPVWVHLGTDKRLVTAEEGAKMKAARLRRRNMKKSKHVAVAEDHHSVHGGLTQMRGAATSGQEKFRVTFLMRQVVHHYFDNARDPVGNQLPRILIVPGVHCRLSNISEHGTWVMDEIFQYGDQQIIRKAGDKVDATIMKKVEGIEISKPRFVQEHRCHTATSSVA